MKQVVYYYKYNVHHGFDILMWGRHRMVWAIFFLKKKFFFISIKIFQLRTFATFLIAYIMSRRSDFSQWLCFEVMRFSDEFRRSFHLDFSGILPFSSFMYTNTVCYPATNIGRINNMIGWDVIRCKRSKLTEFRFRSIFFLSLCLVFSIETSIGSVIQRMNTRFPF